MYTPGDDMFTPSHRELIRQAVLHYGTPLKDPDHGPTFELPCNVFDALVEKLFPNGGLANCNGLPFFSHARYMIRRKPPWLVGSMQSGRLASVRKPEPEHIVTQQRYEDLRRIAKEGYPKRPAAETERILATGKKETRQQIRRALSKARLVVISDKFGGESRRARRGMARELAKKDWRAR
jgi:hypothetical protein